MTDYIIGLLVVTVACQTFWIYRLRSESMYRIESLYRTHARDTQSMQKEAFREATVAYRDAYQNGLKHGKKDGKHSE